MFGIIQSNAILVNRIKTFKETFLDFLVTQSSVFHLDQSSIALERLYSKASDLSYANSLGRKLADLCVNINEHPSIRFLGSSPIARAIAMEMNSAIQQYKTNNRTFWCYGDDGHTDRDRAQILILDRSFDPLSPLMHEYTYEAMVNDLLEVEDGVISYKTTTNDNREDEKKAILGENDDLWVELRHSHIAKVIEVIKERMNDIIQNNTGAKLAKKSGADMDITSMAAAVKALPEYNQTMTKLGQHVAIAQQCMNQFSRQGLMDLSRVEQTISTGFDDDGKEVKGPKLLQLVLETLRNPLSKDQKIRLLAIFYVSQRNIPGSEDSIRQAFQAARLTPSDQQMITNFDRLLSLSQTSAVVDEKKTGGIFSAIFGGAKVTKHPPTPEGEYSDTRHVCLLKAYLEQFVGGNLPLEKFPQSGPTSSAGPKSEAKSVRRFGAANRFGRKDGVQFTGGRYIVFIAGGATYAELRVGYETMTAQQREVIIGSTHITNPSSYLVEVGALPAASSAGGKREDMI